MNAPTIERPVTADDTRQYWAHYAHRSDSIPTPLPEWVTDEAWRYGDGE